MVKEPGQIFDLSDLKAIRFQCGHCKGEVVHQMLAYKIPDHCPLCGESWESRVNDTLGPNHLLASIQPILIWFSTKPKPRWDVHLPGVVNQAGSLTGLPRPLTGGSSGSAVSPLLSGGSILPGTGRPSPAPLPCSRGTDCL